MENEASQQTLNIKREGKLNQTQKAPKVLRFASSDREKLDLVINKQAKKGKPFEKVSRAQLVSKRDVGC